MIDRFRDIEEHISRRLVGQKEAVTAVTKALRMNKGPLKANIYRPDGVLLFLGPTGVGKTEMAKALAEYLFGDERHMVRVDMSEYRDGALAVDKLIGMPRGIVGSERGGILTNQVKDNPYTVVLLDEIEKADTYVHNLFLQAFDEGWLTDGRGKKVYFSDTIIIMTSNLGSGGAFQARPADGIRGGLERVRAGPQGRPEGGGEPVHAGVHQPPRRHRRLRAPVVRRGAEDRLHLPGLDPEDDGPPREVARGLGRRPFRAGPHGLFREIRRPVPETGDR